MVVKEFDYISGNTAAKPERRSTELDRRKYEELKRSKKQRNKRKKEEDKKRIRGVYQIAAVLCILGVGTVIRDGKVIQLQRDVNNLNSEIRLATDENEAIRVELLKFASLDNIKTNAEEKLAMATPTKDSFVQIDLSKNYFSELENEITAEKSSEKKGLFSKIMGVLD